MADEDSVTQGLKNLLKYLESPEGQKEIREAKNNPTKVIIPPFVREQAEALGIESDKFDEVIEDFKETVVPALEAEHKKNIN